MELSYKNIREIILFISLLGFLNIFNILKYGGDLFLSISLDVITWKKMVVIIVLNLIFFIIFNITNPTDFFNFKGKDLKIYEVESKKKENLELSVIIFISWISFNFLVICNSFLLFTLVLELYSFTIYFLILLKTNKSTTHLSILYFLNGSLSSLFLLLGFYFIYSSLNLFSFSSLNLFSSLFLTYGNSKEGFISNIFNLPLVLQNTLSVGLFLVFFSLFLKLGGFPYSQNIIRLYKELDSKILFKLLLFPLVIYLIYFSKIFVLLFPIVQLKLVNFPFFLFIFSLISILFGSLAGLFKNHIFSLLTYSSILNFGYLFLALLLEFSPFSQGIFGFNSFFEFLFIYSLTNLLLFLLLLFFPSYSKIFINSDKMNTDIKIDSYLYKTQNQNNVKSFGFNLIKITSYFVVVNIIFSFIGLPPFAGFYIKLNLILNILSLPSSWTILFISLVFVGTLFSSFFYLKFFFKFFSNLTYNSKDFSFFQFNLNLNSYIISLISIILINYSFLFYFFFPFYNLF